MTTPVPDPATVADDLRTLVAEICAYEPEEIDHDALIFDDLGLDSITLLDVFATLSLSYHQLRGMSPQDADLGDHTTYRDLETLMVSAITDIAKEPVR